MQLLKKIILQIKQKPHLSPGIIPGFSLILAKY